MQAAFKTKLRANNKQATYFKKACGTSRFVWNWGLAEWRQQYKQYSDGKLEKAPNWMALKRQFNAIKHEQYPWVAEVTKYAAQQPFNNLGTAYQTFFKQFKSKSKRKLGAPRFKKKGIRDSFYIGGDQVKVNDKWDQLKVPRLGWVRMAEKLRFNGHINSVVISRTANNWYVSFSMATEIAPLPCESQARCGVDVGINRLATLSQGKRYWDNPKASRLAKRRLARLQRKLAKKKRGSRGRYKQKLKIARLHKRIADIRSNSIHHLTTYLIKNSSSIVIEDLNVQGMMKNHHLAGAVADASFYEIRRQLEYKCKWHNRELVIANRWYPSTQICSSCGVQQKMPLSTREFNCACGFSECRDYNASVNLAKYG